MDTQEAITQLQQYREALYRAGTVVVDAAYRVSAEKWSWSQAGADWSVSLKLVPA